jgi:nucleotide-binding universal stress UspA family protein
MIPETTDSSFHDEAPHLATHNIHFSRILVGTDYSKQARLALRMAITIGEIFGSEIFLVHAVPSFVYGEGSELVAPESLTALLDAAKDEMNELVASEPRLQALRVQTTVDYSGGADLIEQVADKAKVNLIVVGSQGASGLERLLLGSTAETVLRKAACPVLVVGPNCHDENHPFRSILFATDLETTSLRAAQYASALAERVNGRLTFLHVVEDAPRVPGVQSDVAATRLRRELQSLLPADAELFCKPKVRLEYGSPAKAITGVAESESASLIVVGLRNRKPLAEHAPWSTLSHVIREAKCGVLGVHGHLL